MIIATDIPICSEPDLSHSPAIESSSIGMKFRSAAEALPVNPVVHVSAVASAPTESVNPLINVATASRSQDPVGIFRAPGDDVDHSGDCAGSPDRASRAANDFDAFNIFEQYPVLQSPVNAGKAGLVEAP